MRPSIEAGLAMMRDVLARFAVDERHLYATGFSGGARVACAIGQMQRGIVAGVIACGGGFPAGEEPTAETRFALCGTVGDGDFNWTEMTRLDRSMAALGKPHRLLRFAGGHVWPPPAVAAAAVEWLEVQAMKAGTRTVDAAIAQALLRADLERARADEAAGDLLDASRRYAEAAETCRGLVDVTAADARATALAGDERVKREAKRTRDAEQRETRQRAEIERYIAQFSDPERQIDAMPALYGLIGTLQRDARNGRTTGERMLARRLLEHVNITAYYAGQPVFDAGDYQAALIYLQVQAVVHPESPGIHQRIAMSHARSGNRGKALEALKRAAEAGYADAEAVEREPAFEKLRGDPRYEQAVAAIRANKK
jgi:dienelactone hydrolase